VRDDNGDAPPSEVLPRLLLRLQVLLLLLIAAAAAHHDFHPSP